MLSLCVESLAGTHAVAAALAGLARPGDIVALAGEMGVGKTAFAQGFGRALGIDEPMTSPTFTLVHSYPCPGRRLTLHHADLYRLERTGDVADLALHELAEFGGIVLVEWGDVAAAGLGDHLEVRLAHELDLDADPDDTDDADDADPDRDDPGVDERRTIELYATGGTWAGRWRRLEDELAAFRC